MITPGHILTDDMGEYIGLAIQEVAAIVAEWDQGPRRVKPVTIAGPLQPLVIAWDVYSAPPSMYAARGSYGERVYVSTEDIEAMRELLAEAAG